MYFIIKYNAFNKYIINVTTTEINTCKNIFEFGSYLALVQDKKITCVLPANACCAVYVNCPPILHAFPF
jgi:hypothetical protein